jgi:selenocysteine lyase/cysteine desulfurase
VNLQAHGIEIRWWRVDPGNFTCPGEELGRLLTDRTALVAFPHVSNLLGDIVDVKAITELVHEAGARVVVDGVAYAPHRAMDVDAWDVDWYAYSTYKVYGPHMAALYGREDAIAELTGPNHFFIPREEIPYKFELGGPSHEGCSGLVALGEYLAHVAEVEVSSPCSRSTVERAYDVMTACELPLQARLIEYLASKSGVRIIGPPHAEASRVLTVSFVHDRLSSGEITAEVDRNGIAIRNGHMYAYRMCQALGMDPEDGVVRVSGVHYNTPEEIDRLIGVLDRVL